MSEANNERFPDKSKNIRKPTRSSLTKSMRDGIKHKVEELNKQINDISSTIEELKTQVLRLNNKCDENTRTIKRLKEDIDRLDEIDQQLFYMMLNGNPPDDNTIINIRELLDSYDVTFPIVCETDAAETKYYENQNKESINEGNF